MAAVWGPRAEEIIEWASRYEAAAVLPDLVRRLLLATAHVEHVDDVRAREARDHLRLASKTLLGRGLVGDLVAEKLHGDRTTEHRVVSEPDEAHAPLTDEPRDAVWTNALGRHAMQRRRTIARRTGKGTV